MNEENDYDHHKEGDATEVQQTVYVGIRWCTR